MKPTCDGPDCDRPIKSVGMCNAHRMQQLRGQPLTPLRPHMRSRSVVDRLLGKRKIDAGSGCWLWQGATADGTSKGYGRIDYCGTRWKVHRLAWVYLRGPIPEGLEIDHLCRVRNCFNPDHLEVVTRTENNRRMWEAKRAA